jgi:hypothetical protein
VSVICSRAMVSRRRALKGTTDGIWCDPCRPERDQPVPIGIENVAREDGSTRCLSAYGRVESESAYLSTPAYLYLCRFSSVLCAIYRGMRLVPARAGRQRVSERGRKRAMTSLPASLSKWVPLSKTEKNICIVLKAGVHVPCRWQRGRQGENDATSVRTTGSAPRPGRECGSGCSSAKMPGQCLPCFGTDAPNGGGGLQFDLRALRKSPARARRGRCASGTVGNALLSDPVRIFSEIALFLSLVLIMAKMQSFFRPLLI